MEIKIGNYYKTNHRSYYIVQVMDTLPYGTYGDAVVVREVFPISNQIFQGLRPETVLLISRLKEDLGNNEEVIKVLYGN